MREVLCICRCIWHHCCSEMTGEAVTFYSVGGVNLGSAKAVQGVLHFAKPNESIVIAKIKGNDLKIAIK